MLDDSKGAGYCDDWFIDRFICTWRTFLPVRNGVVIDRAASFIYYIEIFIITWRWRHILRIFKPSPIIMMLMTASPGIYELLLSLGRR